MSFTYLQQRPTDTSSVFVKKGSSGKEDSPPKGVCTHMNLQVGRRECESSTECFLDGIDSLVRIARHFNVRTDLDRLWCKASLHLLDECRLQRVWSSHNQQKQMSPQVTPSGAE